MKRAISCAKLADGKKVRLPLDHPELEKIDCDIHELIRSGELNEFDLGTLIKKQRELRHLDRPLARVLGHNPLPVADKRPLFSDDWKRTDCTFGAMIECWAGWVARLREYVQNLKLKYCLAADDEDMI